MLLFMKIKNWCEIIGYTRAASQLASQGLYNESKALLLERAKLQARKTQAIARLDKWKKLKRSYEPANHYMRGKEVAQWRGKAA
tara:strand:+ start:1302 stop:1553 length:252 start_codon:yes stop_codon:yes gene_type:complete